MLFLCFSTVVNREPLRRQKSLKAAWKGVLCSATELPNASLDPFSTCVNDLGVHLDHIPSVRQHISYVRRTSFLALRRIVSIRLYLTESTAAQAVGSFIPSGLDCCNPTLAGFPAAEINRLQRIQNNAARLVL